MNPKGGRGVKQASGGESTSISRLCIVWLFRLIVCGFVATGSIILFQLRRESAILITFLAGAALWALEALENKRRPSSRRGSEAVPGSLAVVCIVALVSFIGCLPTLNIYFLVDDFAFLHAFHNLSSAQFVQLLHMDLGQFVWGDSRQEFRPLYSLFYVAGYHLWGLRPLGYHVCEIIVHALDSALVFLIAKALAPERLRTAGFAGVLFAVQPLHAQATSLIVGLVAESLPALLYLTAFLYFIRFRSSSRLLQLAVSIGAFAVGLLAKESAVTLPIILASYDLLLMAIDDRPALFRDGHLNLKKWGNLVLPYVPYGILLFVYVTWRHKVFASYLREANWGNHTSEAVTTSEGFWLHVTHFALRIWRLQVFNFETLFPYSTLALGLVFGIVLVWALALFRHYKCRKSLALILYFGVAWYLITNLPYLVEEQVIYHLYLPAVGICISVAFLAIPDGAASEKEVRYSRVAGMVLLVILATGEMWKADVEYKRFGDMSARMAEQLAASLTNLPENGLVVIWPGKSELIVSGWGEEILPYSVQPPFTATDLYSNLRIVEHPDMSCCGIGEWWPKVGPMLSAELARPQEDKVSIYLLSWNDSTRTFQQTAQLVPRRVLSDCVTGALGGPPDSVESVDEADGARLVQALTDLAKEGTAAPLEK
jgi:hypothetical protein